MPGNRPVAHLGELRLNIFMAKTQKELAFLRDIYVSKEWTSRFTDLLDKHLKPSDGGNLLYVNAGTGDHVFALRDKFAEDAAVFATCQDEHILAIARDKGAAIGSDVDFSMIRFEDESFDTVVTDAALVPSADVRELIAESSRVAKAGASVNVILVSAGSFGEIFSLLWEVLFNEDLGEHGAAAEQLIADQPTVSQIESFGATAGLVNINTTTAIEVFEYENGSEFVNSPLVVDFLVPKWLQTLSENERTRVKLKLAELIDAEDADLTFRFTVKATLLTGEKG